MHECTYIVKFDTKLDDLHVCSLTERGTLSLDISVNWLKVRGTMGEM